MLALVRTDLLRPLTLQRLDRSRRLSRHDRMFCRARTAVESPVSLVLPEWSWARCCAAGAGEACSDRAPGGRLCTPVGRGDWNCTRSVIWSGRSQGLWTCARATTAGMGRAAAC